MTSSEQDFLYQRKYAVSSDGESSAQGNISAGGMSNKNTEWMQNSYTWVSQENVQSVVFAVEAILRVAHTWFVCRWGYDKECVSRGVVGVPCSARFVSCFELFGTVQTVLGGSVLSRQVYQSRRVEMLKLVDKEQQITPSSDDTDGSKFYQYDTVVSYLYILRMYDV